MLRHLVVLARDTGLLPDRLIITLDRHLARGEQLEIVQDRRVAPAGGRGASWPVGRDRRRTGPLAEQLRSNGYAIFSREDEAAVPPPPSSARFFDRPPVGAAASPRRESRRPMRGRLSDDPDEGFDEPMYDEEERNDFLRPRRGGLLVSALVVIAVVAVATAGMLYLSILPRGRLAEAPVTATPAPPDAPTGMIATEGPAVGDAPPAAAPPAAPAPATPVVSSDSAGAPPPAAPSAPVPSATVESPAPAPSARELPAPPAAVASRELPPSPSLPPRRAQEPAPSPSVPPAARSQRLPVFPGLPRVEVSRAPSAEATTFTVRLTDPRGRPLPDAQVWLRQKSLDGFVRETRLDPVTPAGSYRGAVPSDGRRGEGLTVRFVLGDMRGEMPVAD